MKMTIQLPNEYLAHTVSSGSQYPNPIRTENTSISTSTNYATGVYVIARIAPQSHGSKDVDDFIGELLKQDDSLENDLREGRKWVADVLCDGRPESLKSLRLRAGYSQVQLADRIGMKQPNICEFEAGKRKPSAETLERLANALNTTADILLKSINQTE